MTIDEAIEQLKINTGKEPLEISGSATRMADYFKALSIASEALEEKKNNTWISVKDRLPEKNKVVLCWAKNKTIQGGSNYMIGLCSNGFWFLESHEIGTCSGPVTDYEVLAWMPLPEPYRKDGAADE